MPRLVLGRPADHNARFEPDEQSLRRLVRKLHLLGVPITVETIQLWALVVRHWPSADADSSERSSAAA